MPPQEYRVELVDKMGRKRSAAQSSTRSRTTHVADIIDHRPTTRRSRLLNVDTRHAADIQKLGSYPPDTAGVRIDAHFVPVGPKRPARDGDGEIQGAVDRNRRLHLCHRSRGYCLGIAARPLMIHKPEGGAIGSFMRKENLLRGSRHPPGGGSRAWRRTYRIARWPVARLRPEVIGSSPAGHRLRYPAGSQRGHAKMAGSVRGGIDVRRRRAAHVRRLPWLMGTSPAN